MSGYRYYSQELQEKMDMRGYQSTNFNFVGRRFWSPSEAIRHAKELRTRGFFAQAFAVATRVHDCPSGIVFFKRKKSK